MPFADVPERERDLVLGLNELNAPPNGAIVAVKVIGPLGEERVISLVA